MCLQVRVCIGSRKYSVSVAKLQAAEPATMVESP